MKHNGNGKTNGATNGKAGEPAPAVNVRFFGGLWRYEVFLPDGRSVEGFRSSKTSAEEAAQLWIEARK